MSEGFFEQLKGSTFISRGAVNIGIIEGSDGVYLIDSGGDKDAGRKLYKVVRESGRKIKAVINTHSNADHIGGNAYLQNNAGCEIWTSQTEASFTETPLLEPSFLWGGFPFKELRSKFFEAKASHVDRIISEDSKIEGLNFIGLPGHFFNQYGILTDDGVFFLGDSLFGEDIIKKYGLPFIYDVEAFIGSIEKIMAVKADYYVPCHGDLVNDVSKIAALNLNTVAEAVRDILRLICDEIIFEDLLKFFCDERKITLNHGQYVLVGSTVKSFLSYLYNNGKAEYKFRDNRMYWKAV